MSNLEKIAIPLLNENLEYEDILEKNGFVDAYFENINKPSLVNHMFLLYDVDTTKNYKLNKFDNLYSRRVVYIKGKPYYVFTFTINRTIRRLRDGNIILNNKEKERVLDFWWHKDGWISNNLLCGTIYSHPEPSVLPEEDYMDEFTLNEKVEVLD